MPLRTNTHPEYVIDGFSVVVHTIERHDDRWSYHFDLSVGIHQVGGGSSSSQNACATEKDAHVAAIGHAKDRIQYMLSQKPLEQWQEFGVGPSVR